MMARMKKMVIPYEADSVSIVYSARKVVISALTAGAAAREPSSTLEGTSGAWARRVEQKS
jgi:hypothetical protein